MALAVMPVQQESSHSDEFHLGLKTMEELMYSDELVCSEMLRIYTKYVYENFKCLIVIQGSGKGQRKWQCPVSDCDK